MKEIKTMAGMMAELKEHGIVSSYNDWTENVYVVNNVLSFEQIAEFCSYRSGGQWTGYDYAAHWQRGSITSWIINIDHTDSIKKSRAVVKEVMGSCDKYSVGGCGSALLKWALSPRYDSKKLCSHFNDTPISYHECLPGFHEDVVYWDMSSCYFNMFDRLPSPRATLLSTGRLMFSPLTPDERSKWNDMRQAVREHHTLRNSQWGTGLGKIDGGAHWHKGSKKQTTGYAGPLHVAALLVARLAYELCVTACHDCDAIYSNVDCMVGDLRQPPRIWDKCSVPYSIKHAGDAHILGQGRWKIGSDSTDTYRRYEGLIGEPHPRVMLPEKLYYQQFLL